MEPIRFVTNNKYSFKEAEKILKDFDANFNLIWYQKEKSKEIQTDNIKDFMRNKIITSFDKVRRPLIVEYTGLFFKVFETRDDMGDMRYFPGILTHTIFQSMGAENFAKIFSKLRTKVIARTMIGYTDGKIIKIFDEDDGINGISGKIINEPRGATDKDWDRVFIPKSENKTFAEMGEEKYKISMRRQALEKFFEFYTSDKGVSNFPPGYLSRIPDSDSHTAKLARSIRNNQVVLFIGAGVSQAFKLPGFSAIINRMAKKVGYEPELFELYGEKSSLSEYYTIKNHGLQDLTTWVQEEWSKQYDDIHNSLIHGLIPLLQCSRIYTTNYDSLIEKAQDTFKFEDGEITPIKNISDLLEANEKNKQIIYFHGSASHTESIVLTESKYLERLYLNDPLDLKFQVETMGKSILFLGYSLNDVNLKYLLHRRNDYWKKWKNKNPDSGCKPESYIFLSKPNPVQSLFLNNNDIYTIVSEEDNQTKGLELFLKELVSRAFSNDYLEKAIKRIEKIKLEKSLEKK